MKTDVRQRVIEVTARHFKAPKALRTFVEKEVRKLNRYYEEGVLDYRIILTHNPGIEEAEVIAHTKKHRFVAKESDIKMDRAVVLAVEKVKTQLNRHREKLLEK